MPIENLDKVIEELLMSSILSVESNTHDDVDDFNFAIDVF